MKNLNLLFICLIISVFAINAETWIRVNQMGYLPADVKVAVLISDESLDVNSFKVVGVGGDEYELNTLSQCGAQDSFSSTARLDFSEITSEGEYYIEANGAKSPVFRIGKEVYRGANEVPLKYMRKQRCGYNHVNGD